MHEHIQFYGVFVVASQLSKKKKTVHFFRFTLSSNNNKFDIEQFACEIKKQQRSAPIHTTHITEFSLSIWKIGRGKNFRKLENPFKIQWKPTEWRKLKNEWPFFTIIVLSLCTNRLRLREMDDIKQARSLQVFERTRVADELMESEGVRGG